MKKVYISAYPYMCGLEDRRFHFEITCTKLDKETLKKELSEFNPHGVMAGLEVYDKEIFDICPNLKVISRIGSGVDNVDLEEARKRGIAVLNTPDEPVQAVAELVIGQMINLLRGLTKNPFPLHSKKIGRNLSDCTVGIIGMGRIGTRVYNLLQPFQCNKIYAYDIQDFRTTLDDTIRNSDILTIHIPLTDYNKEFINKDIFEKMKDKSYLINTSRGGVVNEDDLYEYLINGKLAGAALDVFQNEPYSGKLADLTNVLCTPHIGSYTIETRQRMETKALQNCTDYLINN